jgi:glycosyltransferase involved in cell wall biosynthesis
METIYVNGKFSAQATTGVQRVARCMVEALDRRLAGDVAHTGPRWVLLCPPGGQPPLLRAIETRFVGNRGAGLHAWEQWALPRAARGGLLVNLAGAAPAFAARQTCVFHDAAVFDCPEAYTWAFRTWYRWLFRRLARTAVALSTVSEFSKGRLVECLRIPAERIRVIHSGGDHLAATTAAPAYLQAAGLRDRRFVLVVGSDNANKNLAAVIEAFSTLQAEDLRLAVVGGSAGAVFASTAGKTSDDARVVRLGQVGDAELKALYSAATCLVFASRYEGFGLPPLEAMSCGCPVLASTAASIPEVCGDAALYADPQSPARIAEALARLLGDAELREQFAKKGRERLTLFTWDAAAAKLQAQLEGLPSGAAMVPA